MMNYNLTTLNAPSGEFMEIKAPPEQTLAGANYVCNPGMLVQTPVEVQPVGLDYSKWASDCSQKKPILQRDFDEYGEALVEIVGGLSQIKGDCVLGPLRGAARPCLLVEVMTKYQTKFEFFNFQDGSKGERDAEIRRELIEILRRNDPGRETYVIQILDTAIGGYGITKLISLLRDIHDTLSGFQRQFWIVDVHLLHPDLKGENRKRILSAKANPTKEFTVDVHLYPVSDLIVEDYDEAIGFTLETVNGKTVAKPSVNPGRFLFKDGAGVRLIETSDLYTTFTEIYSTAITDSLITSSDRELIRVVWEDYQNKG